MIKILKKILPEQLFIKIRELFRYFKSFKARNYNLSEDLAYNNSLLNSLGMNIENIRTILEEQNQNYLDKKISWHYHLFAGLRQFYKSKNINILEIGTFSGEFTNFLSKIYPNSQITTIDLDENDKKFVSTYNRDYKENMKTFLQIREKNLNRENINFIKMNSSNIKEYFKEKKFNLIWVDGDHLFLQIFFDLINSINSLSEDGIMCSDDIIIDKNFKRSEYISTEGYQILNYLEKNNEIRNFYLIKKIHLTNFYIKKYISISVLNDNKIFKKII